MKKMKVRTVPQLVSIAERLDVLGPENAPRNDQVMR
jgi:hypothetical protein